jgi:hypothetical protein
MEITQPRGRIWRMQYCHFQTETQAMIITSIQTVAISVIFAEIWFNRKVRVVGLIGLTWVNPPYLELEPNT